MFLGNWDTVFQHYDQIQEVVGWPSPALVATLVDSTRIDKFTAEILDCGVGTGELGNELRMRGFQHLSGFDGCREMVRCSTDRGIYKHLFQQFVTTSDSFTTEYDGKFDVICSSGVLCKGSMPPNVF